VPSFAGSLITGPFQIELNGVLMDAVDEGASIVITKWLQGLGIPSTMRNANKALPQRDGEFASPQYLGSRPVQWSVACRGDNSAGVVSALQQVGRALSPVPDDTVGLTVPLVFTLADASQRWLLNGKPERAATSMDNFLRTYLTPEPFTDEIQCEFVASDPNIYDFVLQSQTTGLGVSSGGLGFPFGFPFGFGTSVPGQILTNNLGNRRSYPTIYLFAGSSGLSGITVTNQLTGESWSTSLVMNANDSLAVDMAARTVVLNGNQNRAATVNRPPSSWFGIDPVTAGATLLTFVGSGPGSTMTVSYRSAWAF
jgi:hypothetical protein